MINENPDRSNQSDLHFNLYGNGITDIYNKYLPPTTWPKVKTPLKLPRVINFFTSFNSILSPTPLRQANYRTFFNNVKAGLTDISNLYINYDLEGGYSRLLQSFIPRMEDIDIIDPGIFNKKIPFIGTDVLFIIFYQDMANGNAYADAGQPQWGLSSTNPSLTQATRDSWLASDKALIAKCFPLFRNYAIWIYHDTVAPHDVERACHLLTPVPPYDPPYYAYCNWDSPNEPPSGSIPELSAPNIFPASDAFEASWLNNLCSSLTSYNFTYKGDISSDSLNADTFINLIKTYFEET